ncbi:MAG TPA: FtsX-like permease family protein [Candidatus Bathyarchaeia archaeon]|nr:FtsX-like permease family protein [Candidatus Bathyarchaeia archaeon]
MADQFWATYALSCSAQLSYYDYYFTNNDSFEGYPLPSGFNNVIMETIEESPLREKLPLCTTNFRVYTFSALSYEAIINESTISEDYVLGSIGFHVIPNEIFQYITPYATWENTNVSSEAYAILFVQSSDLIPSGPYGNLPYWSILEHDNITVADIDNEMVYSNPITIKFSHKILYESYGTNEVAIALNSYIFSNGDSGIIITENLFKQLLSSFYGTLETIEYPQNFASQRVFVNAHVIDDISKREYTFEEYQQLEVLKNQIENKIILKTPLLTELHMHGPTGESAYENLYIELHIEQLKFTLLAIPLVLLLGILIYMQNQLFLSNKTTLTNFLNLHGITRKQLLFSEVVLFLCFALLGLGIGMLLAIPIVLLGYSSVGFITSFSSTSLVFSGTAFLQTLAVYCGIIFLVSIPLLLNQTNQLSLSRQKKDKNLLSRKMRLVAFIVSFIISLTLLLVTLLVPSTTYAHSFYVSTSINLFIVILTISSIVITLSIVGQLFSSVFSQGFRQKHPQIFSFSLKNISLNNHKFKQGFLVFFSTALIAILFTSVSFGLISTKLADARYDIGADARLSLTSEIDTTQIMAALPSTIHGTEVIKLEGISNSLDQQMLSFYYINTSSYTDVAYHSKSKIGLSLQMAMNYLDRTNSCLIEGERANELSLQRGGTYSLKVQEGETIFTQDLEIAAFVDGWPFFISERLIKVSGMDINEPLEIIVSFTTGKYLFDTFEEVVVNRYLLLDFTNYKDDLAIITKLVTESEALDELVVAREKFNYYLNEPMTRIVINFSLFSSFVTLLLLLSFAFFFAQKIFYEQCEEVHLYLSLGATTSQLTRLFFFELLIILLPAILLGTGLGLLLLNTLKDIALSTDFNPEILIMVVILITTFVVLCGFSLLIIYLAIKGIINSKLKRYHFSKEEKIIGN